MITIKEAIELIKKNLPERKEELRKTYSCNHFTLAEDIYAQFPSPYFDNCAMDGYAISIEDAELLLSNFNQNNEFEVIGISQAGKPFTESLSSGKCIQINTGAKVPQNTGAIIPVEDVEYMDSDRLKIRVKNIHKKFQHIRRKGEEFQENSFLLPKGTILNPRNIALLLQSGKNEIFVYKKPKILLITTGTELISFQDGIIEEDMENGKILDTNAYLLSAVLEDKNYEFKLYSQIQDEEGQIYNILQNNNDYDIIIITGGVSVGPYDYVKKDVEKAGFKPVFWKIKQKPGKPFYFAKKENTVLFGLPGNPVSSFINFQHYVLPAIKYLESGQWLYNHIFLKSKVDISNEGNRDIFFTIRIKDKEYFELAEQQGSHKLSSIAYSDGYIIVPVGSKIQQNESLICYQWM
ncbi:MAG: molybdopterin molybdenumtransferase [Leptospiraceae bacterium]|nr:MAG: molybdopterin molybdenumtransferase [Leptospiraceae bacterium]